MNSEDPNVLSRIAWGAADQKEELLRQLGPHLDSTDPARRKHAEVLRRIFSGELKNSLNRELNQCGNFSFISATVSGGLVFEVSSVLYDFPIAILARLGAEPPQPAWCG